MTSNTLDPAFDKQVKDIIRNAIIEDVGTGDATSIALIDSSCTAEAFILAKTKCVVCGTTVAKLVFEHIDPKIECEILLADGTYAEQGDILMKIAGNARMILSAERTALNFMQRLSGISSLTKKFVDAVAGTGVTILDTRKTTPCFRTLEKYAVKCGGGANHRFGLFDKILIKDNHRKLWKMKYSSLGDAVKAARRQFPNLEIEIEVETEADLQEALSGKPDWVLLDNMATDLMRKCVTICKGKCLVEASGGITLENVRNVAETGVDAISLGCLTHSAPSVDMSMEIYTK